MDIRTKLVFALVSVALASMLALGVMMYSGVESELEDRTLEQLSGLAEFKAQSLEGIVAGWRDRVGLVANQLRVSLRSYGAARDPAEAARMSEILGDALVASTLFRRLRVLDRAGEVVAAAGIGDGGTAVDLDMLQDATFPEPRFGGVTFSDDDAAPVVSFLSPLDLDGERIGYLHASISIDEVVALSANYDGLGRTGETMVVTSDDGTARILHPVRAAPPFASASTGSYAGRFSGAGLVVSPTGPAAASLGREEVRYAGGIVDYRGEEVWAATDFLPTTGWGVVVKLDAAENNQPIRAFREDMVRLAVTLAAFAIFIGTLMGIRFAQPIHLLAEAARRIRDGDLDARTGIQRQDEVGFLARTFDQMADELEEQVGLLSEFRRFFDMSIDMMCIAETDGYFKRVNNAFVRELGWSHSQLLERPFVSFVHPDDVDATLAEIEKLAEGTPTISFENRYLCKDGSYKRLRWNTFPEEGTGRLYAIARAYGVIPPENP